MVTLSSIAGPDDELKLVSVLLSERDEESDEVERGRDLCDDPQGCLGSSKISVDLVSEIGRRVIERRDLL